MSSNLKGSWFGGCKIICVISFVLWMHHTAQPQQVKSKVPRNNDEETSSLRGYGFHKKTH